LGLFPVDELIRTGIDGCFIFVFLSQKSQIKNKKNDWEEQDFTVV
jgi:hypothetical protein